MVDLHGSRAGVDVDRPHRGAHRVVVAGGGVSGEKCGGKIAGARFVFLGFFEAASLYSADASFAREILFERGAKGLSLCVEAAG